MKVSPETAGAVPAAGWLAWFAFNGQWAAAGAAGLAFAAQAVLLPVAVRWLAAPRKAPGVRAAGRAGLKALAADTRQREEACRRNREAVKAIEQARGCLVINGSEARFVPCRTDPPGPPGISVRDMALGFAHLSAVLGPCSHVNAEPVELLLTGERVAWLCPECEERLPAGWQPATGDGKPSPGPEPDGELADLNRRILGAFGTPPAAAGPEPPRCPVCGLTRTGCAFVFGRDGHDGHTAAVLRALRRPPGALWR